MSDSDRWQHVSRIFEAALSLESEARAAYVEAQCGGDSSLRHEVEQLIQSHQKASDDNFMSGHAFERAAPVLAAGATEFDENKPRLVDGQNVSHYQVIQRIGAGGMGEVYLAKDTRLGRTVALKILPADVASDQRRMLRFYQEARIVSALNQPNILTIFEFGETHSLHFIATEYIDGETLRQHLRGKKIRLHEILDVGIQVTAALDAAHEAKIVHRDIKPENIMIRRRDGVVKVLDFGLAKLAEKAIPSGQSTDTEAVTEMKTMTGSVMGTINYMSPEQAQGLTVDERTDIWSLGVVLYEMVAGYTPFSGPTSSHTVVQILESEPATLTQSAQLRVPPELERIVSKTLAKNADQRYQTTKDLLIDLKNLRKRLEVEAELGRTGPVTFDAVTSATNEGIATSSNTVRTRLTWPNLVVPIFIAAVVIGVVVIGFSVWSSSRSSILPPAPAAAPVAERQLNYWMSVQKYKDGKPNKDPFRLAGEINFEQDYRVRLNVSSPQPGYLYILNEGPSAGESLSILFPSSTANSGSALLSKDQQVQIPEDSWFAFDAQQGVEKLWLVFSPTSIPELEAVKSFANRRDQGVITNPDLNRAAQGLIQANSLAKPIVEKNDERKETSVRSTGNVLVHLVRLEHH